MAGDTHDAAVGASADDRISSILSELDGADFEFVDPPADVWAGIEAAITCPLCLRTNFFRRYAVLGGRASTTSSAR